MWELVVQLEWLRAKIHFSSLPPIFSSLSRKKNPSPADLCAYRIGRKTYIPIGVETNKKENLDLCDDFFGCIFQQYYSCYFPFPAKEKKEKIQNYVNKCEKPLNAVTNNLTYYTFKKYPNFQKNPCDEVNPLEKKPSLFLFLSRCDGGKRMDKVLVAYIVWSYIDFFVIRAL